MHNIELPKMMKMCLLLLCAATLNYGSFTPVVKTLNYSEDHIFNINKSLEYILQFTGPEKNFPPRVTIDSNNSDISAPLMVVARQTKELLSWQLPLILEGDAGKKNYTKISRTLCEDIYSHNNMNSLISGGQNLGAQIKVGPIVSISTSSEVDVKFTVRVDYQYDFIILPSEEMDFTVSPSAPKYFFYNFSAKPSSKKENYDTVILEVHSNDTVCMTVSIQNASCPVFDTNEDITFRGFYETVNYQGGITIPRDKFPRGFFVVFVAKSDDSDCLGVNGMSTLNRTKTIRLIVKPSIAYNDYMNAVTATFVLIGAFYIVFSISFFLCSRRSYAPRQMEFVNSEAATPSTACAEPLDSISVDEIEYDLVRDSETDRVLRLSRSILYLSDLARKDPRIHKHRSYLYLYNLLTVSLFYALPAIQLVITYQRVLNTTGQQDLCYYNFFCAHPWWTLSDANHVFSNIGYIMLGILFLLITYKRELAHKDLVFESQYGIPQHYGMFYAMAVALIMEGILSGSYHICPNQANFQFDTSFMYVMAVLCIVKLYQNRHPDINATACATYGVLAIAILVGMIGILEGNLYFWIAFTVIYIVSCFVLSIQIYYMGCWSLDRGLFTRIWQICVYDFWAGPLNIITPTHKARMCLVIVGNLCNWALAFWGVYRHQKDFAIFLLAVFMANTLLYFFFYILMKYINKERVNKLSMLFLAISIVCAASAMYFFLRKGISWALTPAMSRQFNHECILLDFYDFHDIWHFLSATGMFFTFMVLLTLDDDLSHTHRSLIVVF